VRAPPPWVPGAKFLKTCNKLEKMRMSGLESWNSPTIAGEGVALGCFGMVEMTGFEEYFVFAIILGISSILIC
jgi:hypothetical protein